MKKVLVKITGSYGAGKSTLAKEVKHFLIKKNFRVIDNSDFTKLNKLKRYTLPILYIFRNKTVLKNLILLIWVFLKTKSFNYREIKGYYNVIKIYIARNFILREKNFDVCVFEQGGMCAFPITSLYKNIDLDLFFNALYENRRIITLIVYVKTPISVAEKRIIKDKDNYKGRWELLNKTPSERKKIYEKIDDKFKHFSDHLSGVDHINFIEVDGTKPPKENAMIIYNEFLKIFKDERHK